MNPENSPYMQSVPDCQNLISSSLAHCQPSLKISCKSIKKFSCKVAVKDCTHLANSGKTIILCWIPSHVHIRGNERADTAAKSALYLPITNMKLPGRELIPFVFEFCLDEW